jgi:hypothetical protein
MRTHGISKNQLNKKNPQKNFENNYNNAFKGLVQGYEKILNEIFFIKF